jgi:hypothetical protein
VLALRRDLGQLNYYESAADGIFGPATVAAIKDFQRANGLPVDGVAGPNTMAKIKQQLVTGDNQMGPSGPPVKPANPAPSKPENSTPGHAPGEIRFRRLGSGPHFGRAPPPISCRRVRGSTGPRTPGAPGRASWGWTRGPVSRGWAAPPGRSPQ